MLCNLNQILAPTRDGHFAVGAFNVTESTMFKAIVETAEACNAPTIIQVSPNEFAFAEKEQYLYFVSRLQRSSVPFVLHLDHCTTFDGCVQTIQAGFTSVMFDGSKLPYEENISKTREIVKMAHAAGVSVEGEIGCIGETLDFEKGIISDLVYSSVADAVRFVQDTEVDALAVSVGTVHGLLPKSFVPKLQIDRIREIAAAIETPLVLHGGSGTPEDQVMLACQSGISKVNISSEFKNAYYQSVRAFVEKNPTKVSPTLVLKDAVEQVKRVVYSKIETFGAMDKAYLYDSICKNHHIVHIGEDLYAHD